jgi:subtilisin family serine protease
MVPPGPFSGAFRRAQHLARLGVDRWHAAGYRGQGIKIAVLDSGFRGYRAFLGNALPARVSVRSFRNDCDLEARESQHGILCGEVLHALAPDAQLLFANWEPDAPEKFLEALRWAKAQGANIISCSLIMPSWSDGEGGGQVNTAVARIVGHGATRGDLLCFASAGNTAQRHWSGPLRCGPDGFHQWNASERDNRLTPWGNDRVSVELYGPAGVRCELSVHDATTGAEVGRATVRHRLLGHASESCAVVRFQPQARRRYQIRVHCDHPPALGRAEPFHLVVLGGYLDCTTSKGSIPCPADGPGVLAVGAVDVGGRRLFYSSCGPNSRQPKPDFVAEVPFPSLWRTQPFAGTSAAAPQAAGLAALWWSRHPDWTPGQVSGAMRTSARDLGPPGHDFETGYGLVTLP